MLGYLWLFFSCIRMIRRLAPIRAVWRTLAGVSICALFYHNIYYCKNGGEAHGQGRDSVNKLIFVPGAESVNWPRLITNQSVACRPYDVQPDSKFGKHVSGAAQLDCKKEGVKPWVQILDNIAVLHAEKHGSLVKCCFQGNMLS